MKQLQLGIAIFVFAAITLSRVVVAAQPITNSPTTTEVAVTITGGFQTERVDNGRPVVLIASMLGVTPEVFREAFSGVTPAKNGAPSGAEARANKNALLKVLSPYGITNEQLDEVSNYYRYKASQGETWAQTQAEAVATIVDGKITGITITNAGAGYTSTPKVTVRYGGITYPATAAVAYTQDFATNGSITDITLNP